MKSSRLESFCEAFYISGLENKEQVLLEAVRAVFVYHHIRKMGVELSDTPEDQERLFREMKRVSEENKFGHFPGDREFFHHLYSLADKLDLLELLVKLNQHERAGIVMVPDYLVHYLAEGFTGQTKTVLIAEAEKMAAGLRLLIKSKPEQEFTLTTEKYIIYMLLKAVFAECSNVRVVNQSIYRELLFKEQFDKIICIPSFGNRLTPEDTGKNFLTRESESTAIENLLQLVPPEGELTAVVPAKLTFASGPVQDFRRWILEHYCVSSIYALPEGIFRPFTSVKTYTITVSKTASQDTVAIGRLEENNYRLVQKQEHALPYDDFKQLEGWRIELFFVEAQEAIQRFKSSATEKIKLKEVAEIFRGKSVMKDDIQPGKIGVLNISNIDNGEILLDGIDTIQEEERKVKRYQLLKDDIVLTCRGTVNKVALTPVTERLVIASANIIVIRLDRRVLPGYLKIFLGSPVGQMLIKSFQRGTTVMNINPGDLGELEIPLIPMEQQRQIIEEFEAEHKKYRQALAEIEQRWARERDEIYSQFIDGGN